MYIIKRDESLDTWFEVLYNNPSRVFPGGPVVRCFHCQRLRFNSWSCKPCGRAKKKKK